MKAHLFSVSLCLCVKVCLAQTWVSQESGTQASLRGLGALNQNVVWASGTGGTYLHTSDGGAQWSVGKVPGAERLDFRDLHIADANTVYLLSIGTGEQSRIYRTTDAGATWKLLFTNPDAKGFFDGLSFWDARHGIIVGDPVDGHAGVFTTEDGGGHWTKQQPPAAIGNEGCFAASGTSLAVRGKREAWYVTGGPGAARAFHTRDGGVTWTAAPTPIRNDSASAGIFSVAFADARRGIAVGGDYNQPNDTTKNVAVTADGGLTWTAPAGAPHGFRSAVVYVPRNKMWIAAGTSGSDVSYDNGNSWKNFDTGAFNSIAFAGTAGWAVGPRGRVAVFRRQ